MPWARSFYELLGTVTMEVGREMPGHVADRLQAALWREAIRLVGEGVAGAEDVDTAVFCGARAAPGRHRPGAAVPSRRRGRGLGRSAAGEGGLAAFREQYAGGFRRGRDDLGDPRLDPPAVERLVLGLAQAEKGTPIGDLAEQRDALVGSFTQVKG
ncbi:3-hydroxyacyl-CoA dehydrogenase family protein [Streptomyces spinosirectus]